MAPEPENGFNRPAAVTRSLLGYGVIVGPIYLIIGLLQAVTREGFDLTRHSLSMLSNGSLGWIQVVNFILCGAMVLAAAIGMARAMSPARGAAIAAGVYGAGLILAGIFPADAADGFPPGTPAGTPDEISVTGLVHLAAGGIGFVALAVSFFLLAAWFGRRGSGGLVLGSRVSGVVMLVAFFVGVAVPVATIALIWVTVLVGWAWLAVASVAVYRTVPHPDGPGNTKP